MPTLADFKRHVIALVRNAGTSAFTIRLDPSWADVIERAPHAEATIHFGTHMATSILIHGAVATLDRLYGHPVQWTTLVAKTAVAKKPRKQKAKG